MLIFEKVIRLDILCDNTVKSVFVLDFNYEISSNFFQKIGLKFLLFDPLSDIDH